MNTQVLYVSHARTWMAAVAALSAIVAREQGLDGSSAVLTTRPIAFWRGAQWSPTLRQWLIAEGSDPDEGTDGEVTLLRSDVMRVSKLAAKKKRL